MRNRLGIQIATDQMNGRDFELLISLSQSFWSPDTKRRDYGLRGSLSKPSGCSANRDILHTYRIQFCLQHCYYILTVSSKKLFFCSCFCYWYHIFAIFRPPFAFGKSREKLSPWDFTLCIICKKGFWFLRQGVKPANPQFMLPLLWNGSWQVLKVGLVFEVLFSSFSESTFQWWG